MKTSFYFVLWILIYPIIGLFNNSFIDNNAFVIAFVIVWGISWLLNRMMPYTLVYERFSQAAPILEDVYTGNVSSFKKRLVRDSDIETVTAIYLTVTTTVIALAIFKSGAKDWFALVIFGLFTYGAIAQSVSFIRARMKLKSDPTPEKCREIADETYKLDYGSYYDAHYGISFTDMIPPKPRHIKAFNVFSVVMAAIASLLGLLYIIFSVLIMFSQTSIEAGALAGMYFLYGSLAAYFGVKDFVSCFHTKSNTMIINKEQTA